MVMSKLFTEDKEMARKKMMGVYILRNTITDQYYIGSSVDFWWRKQSHASFFRAGTNMKRLQALYDRYGEDSWEMELVEEVDDVKKLEVRESEWLYKHGDDVLCVNKTKNTHAPIRGTTQTPESNEKRAKSMVGVNLKGRQKARKPIVSFIGPDGTEYSGITNVAKFARDHNVSQSSLTQLLYGKRRIHRGWRLPEDEFLNLLSPDGKKTKINDIPQFLNNTGIPAVTFSKLINGSKNSVRGWRVA